MSIGASTLSNIALFEIFAVWLAGPEGIAKA